MAAPGSSSGAVTGSIPPPPGVVPNFSDPPRDNSVVIASIVLLSLTLFFAPFRVYTKGVALRDFGSSDVTFLISVLLSIGAASSMFELAHLDYGLDLWNVPFGSFDGQGFSRWGLVYDTFYLVALGFIKVSILLFYLRFFKVRRRVFWFTYLMVAFIALYTISGVFSIIFACRPTTAYWDFLPFGQCVDIETWGVSFATFQLFADVVILCIPIPLALPMHLGTRQKVFATAILSAGIFCTVASVLRLVNILHGVGVPTAETNLTMTRIPVDFWSTIELFLGIIISCMPTFTPFITNWRGWGTQISSEGSSPAPPQLNSSTMRTQGSLFLRGGRRGDPLGSYFVNDGEAGVNFAQNQHAVFDPS